MRDVEKSERGQRTRIRNEKTTGSVGNAMHIQRAPNCVSAEWYGTAMVVWYTSQYLPQPITRYEYNVDTRAGTGAN